MPLTAELASLPFCCGETEGDKDLEDFFHHNALLYAQERLGKTYCFVNNEGEFSEIVAFLMYRQLCDSYRGAYGMSLRYQDRGSGHQQTEQGWF